MAAPTSEARAVSEGNVLGQDDPRENARDRNQPVVTAVTDLDAGDGIGVIDGVVEDAQKEGPTL
ncbi:hypothetical protein GCM10011345_32470 [Gemmobacter megaterium]|nr:hypothetical protein GCM10011345_32470 [Gemmobacter megaterium]